MSQKAKKPNKQKRKAHNRKHVITDRQWTKLRKKLKAKEVETDNPNVLVVTRAYYQTRLLAFAKQVLREHVLDEDGETVLPFSPMHKEIAKQLLDPNIKRLALAAPRGHAKSTLVSFFNILHAALYKRKKNIVIVSASEALAVSFLRRIKTELEFNPKIQILFGPQKSEKWSETEIILSNGVAIHAKGRGAQLRGLISGANRPDYIVLDDIEDEELVRSEIRRADLEQWFNSTVIPTVAPKLGQIVLIGTILHQDSLLNSVLTTYKDFTTAKYSALDENDQPIWPEKFTKKFLNKIRDSYIARHQLPSFYMEYMNDPSPVESAVFHDRDFQFYNPDHMPDRRTLTVEVSIDLGGGSTKKGGDYTAIVVTGTSRNNKVYVLEVIAEQMGTDTDRLINLMFEVNSRYTPQTMFVEKTMATNFILATLETEQLNRGQYMPIKLITPPRGAGKRAGMSDAKFQRISALAPQVRAGNILFLPNQHRLFKEAYDFPRGKHDDVLDALAYTWMFGHRSVIEEEQEEEEEPEFTPLFSELYN